MKQSIDGFLLLDKPIGLSSNQALQKIKRLFNAKKAGHTGCLDPLATGMLPICFGEATKFSQFLLEANKTYQVTMRLGVRTTTSDSEGEVIAEKSVSPDLTIEKLDALFNRFRGKIQQTPSMYSALKHQGKPLYFYARQGINIERPSRPIEIFSLDIQLFSENEITFQVSCSKGTYVRTLVDDFGECLGCGAHVTQLRRLSVDAFGESKMVGFDTLEKTDMFSENNPYLLTIESALTHLPLIQLKPGEDIDLWQGKSVAIEQSFLGLARVVNSEQQFVGIARCNEAERLIAYRLLSNDRCNK